MNNPDPMIDKSQIADTQFWTRFPFFLYCYLAGAILFGAGVTMAYYDMGVTSLVITILSFILLTVGYRKFKPYIRKSKVLIKVHGQRHIRGSEQ